MKKNPNHNSGEASADVPADEPAQTMRRFTDGLKTVLSADKTKILKRGAKKRKRPKE